MSWLVLGLWLLGSGPGAEPTAGPELSNAAVRLSLREVIALAVAHYPELPVVEAQRAQAEALEAIAQRTRRTPQLSGTALLGTVPAARGDLLSSPDSPRQLGDLGPFWRLRLDARWPLYAFGRFADAERAAQSLVASRGAKRDAVANRARELAARSYFGHLLAQQGLALIEEVGGHLEELEQRLAEPGAGGAAPDPLAALRARTYRFELDKLQAEAESRLVLAGEGLRAVVGYPLDAAVRPAAERLEPISLELPDLETGLREAAAARPELKELELAAEAKRLWARSVSKQSWPALGLEGRAEYGEAPGRDKQDNPFAYDPFNVLTLGAALALRWDLNFQLGAAQAAQATAEADELQAQRDALLAKTRIEVIEAHARLAEAQRIYQSSRRARSAAANWLRVAEESHALGTSGWSDLIDAFSSSIRIRGDQLEAIHDLNLALLGWRLALGREPLEAGESL